MLKTTQMRNTVSVAAVITVLCLPLLNSLPVYADDTQTADTSEVSVYTIERNDPSPLNTLKQEVLIDKKYAKLAEKLANVKTIAEAKARLGQDASAEFQLGVVASMEDYSATGAVYTPAITEQEITDYLAGIQPLFDADPLKEILIQRPCHSDSCSTGSV